MLACVGTDASGGEVEGEDAAALRSKLDFSEKLLQRKEEDPTYDASSAEFLVLGEATCGDVIDLQYANAYDGRLVLKGPKAS
ncbi:hypothetical protein OV203_42155 [Nannocystis sp. ILAH1]|uniref:hypothetical protein n=1 Tax=unclassified Nannocystis TaxID=2627009 RepID=UPI00226FE0BB|nr:MULTISPECIES: hypothetical protein [unclassified Nannocystis]MCY0993817.1 hypothetical protein [Nannocystis sp. ILAH1]MCY1065819.1 hypothetical protein [Nannocystis sp. RBIL2]